MLRVILLAALVVVVSSTDSVLGQNWTPEQQEVLDALDRNYDIWASGDTEAYIDTYHDDYVGWWGGSPLPATKEMTAKGTRHYAGGKVHLYSIWPLAVLVHGDVAVVHYGRRTITENADGETRDARARCTDVLLKDGEVWYFYADSCNSE